MHKTHSQAFSFLLSSHSQVCSSLKEAFTVNFSSYYLPYSHGIHLNAIKNNEHWQCNYIPKEKVVYLVCCLPVIYSCAFYVFVSVILFRTLWY